MDPAPKIPPQPPPALISAQDILPILSRVLQDERDVDDALVRTIRPATACFDNTVRPLIDVENRTCGVKSVIEVLRFASPDPVARKAAEEAERLLLEAAGNSIKRRHIYLLFSAVKDKLKAGSIDPEYQAYIDHRLAAYRRFGHGKLDDDQMAQVLESKAAVDRMCQAFCRNLMDDQDGLVLSGDDLDGLAPHDLARFRIESDVGSKQYFVRFTRSHADVILKFAKNPAVRKKFHVAECGRLQANAAMFREVLIRRSETAWKLGYRSHAVLQLETRMVKNIEYVYALLDSLQSALLPRGRMEMDLLLADKRRNLSSSKYVDDPDCSDIMPPWDFAYYTRLAEEALEVDHERIAEYFPLQTTLPRMLRIFGQCLQLSFQRLAPEQMAGSSWHQDVQGWSIWDAREGEFVGYLFADLLSRQNKYRGSQNCNLQKVHMEPCASVVASQADPSQSYLGADGGREYPATVLMCSFPRPTVLGHTLLKHHEMVSLFHELGHGLHDVLSRTACAYFHGWQAPPDFSEAPSVMLENWCWMRGVLKDVSCHYTTLCPQYLEKWQEEHPGLEAPWPRIPDQLVDDLVKSREHNRALWFLGQLRIARFDMMVHDARDSRELERLDLADAYYRLGDELCFQSIPDASDRGHPYAHFGHLLSGYDAGYYSYLCAHVVAANVFETAFADAPFGQATWDRYRRAVLQPGGSRDGLGVLSDFVGHPLDTGALLRSLSLHEETTASDKS